MSRGNFNIRVCYLKPGQCARVCRERISNNNPGVEEWVNDSWVLKKENGKTGMSVATRDDS